MRRAVLPKLFLAPKGTARTSDGGWLTANVHQEPASGSEWGGGFPTGRYAGAAVTSAASGVAEARISAISRSTTAGEEHGPPG